MNRKSSAIWRGGLKGGKADAQAGGGWVNDSIPEEEFQETVNKSKAMLKASTLIWSSNSPSNARPSIF